MTINKLNGTECGTEIAKKINTIIDEKASVSLDNLDTDGQAILDGKVNSSDLFDANEHIKINKLQSYSLPSNSYVNLTLSASGSNYTAPADGYYCLYKVSSGSGQFIQMVNRHYDTNISATCITVYSSANTQYVGCTIPCAKGNNVFIAYSLGGTTEYFRFCYAKGSAPQS